ncbi:MAG TPA: AbrB/MazE/SpoVT family DNA-binding domain-containing protein [Euryarchaeota archaeon]|nr:AbrB/MazE/SpoVT family DNA-binding domain-containing protein [Euryarchaeota archaeon]
MKYVYVTLKACTSMRKLGQLLTLPPQVRKLLKWRPDEVLFFRKRGNTIEVTKCDGYTARMTKGKLHIPADIARNLNIKDGSIVELIPKDDGTLIIRLCR